MYSMLYGHLPFENELKSELSRNQALEKHPVEDVNNRTWTSTTVYQLYNFIISRPLKIPKSSQVSEDAKDLIRGMLQVDPVDRLNLDQILQSPWMTCST